MLHAVLNVDLVTLFYTVGGEHVYVRAIAWRVAVAPFSAVNAETPRPGQALGVFAVGLDHEHSWR